MNKDLLHYSYSMKIHTQKRILFAVIYIIFILGFTNLFISHVLFPVRQSSESMIPDIQENSFVMISPMLKKYNRGDIVLMNPRKKLQLTKAQRFINLVVGFFTAQQCSLYEKTNFPGTNCQLRRIVGLPGDRLYMRDYVLYVKPEGSKHYLTEFEIADNPYNVTFFTAPSEWDSYLGVKGSFDEIVLSENQYFVLGDNRKSSDDSRLYGPVISSDIKGKALLCYFPLNKFRFF
jgi:signal peptidase I